MIEFVYIGAEGAKRVQFDDALDENQKYEEIRRMIDCRCIGISDRKIGRKHFSIVYDDEFLLNGKAENGYLSGLSTVYEDFTGYMNREQLFGNIIITKYSAKTGNNIGLTDKQIEEVMNNIVTFRGHDCLMYGF